MSKPTVSNTTQEANDNPLLYLFLTSGEGGIERMEANGQRELVASEQIPRKIDDITEDQLQSLRFVLGDPTPGDDLFRQAALPEGWSRKRTDHSMWSNIVDEQGRSRFSVFYKAAFYDRDAFMRPCVRFCYATDYDGTPDNPNLRRIYLTDDGQRFGEPVASYQDRDWPAYRAANETAARVLAERYPDHENPMAYWDRP